MPEHMSGTDTVIYTVTATTTYDSMYDKITTPRQAAVLFSNDVVNGWITVFEVEDDQGVVTRVDLDVDDSNTDSDEGS